MNERELLREFSTTGSEAALRELLREYLPLVRSVALRQSGGDSMLADDISQETFCILARKAGRIPETVVLSGWLCRTAFHVAQKALRTEARRRRREQEAGIMQTTIPDSSSASGSPWAEIEPHLDAAMEKLGEADRSALMLRFFERKRMRDVAARLGVSEEAARMRVSRALERLRGLLTRRGVSITPAALAVCLAEKTSAAVSLQAIAAIQRRVGQFVSARAGGTVVHRPGSPWSWLKMAAVVCGLMSIPLAVMQLRTHRELARGGAVDRVKELESRTGAQAVVVEKPIFDFEGAAAALRKALRDPWPSRVPPFERVDAALETYGRYQHAAAPVLMEMLLGDRSKHTIDSMTLAAHGLMILGPDAESTLDDLVILHDSGDLAFAGEKEPDLFAAIDLSGTTIPKLMELAMHKPTSPKTDSILVLLLRNNPGVAPMYRDELLEALQAGGGYQPNHAAIIMAQVPSLYGLEVLPRLLRMLKAAEVDDPNSIDSLWGIESVKALRAVKAPEGIEPLLQLARSEKASNEIRNEALAALAEIDSESGSPADEVRKWKVAHEAGERLAERIRKKDASFGDLVAALEHRESVTLAAQELSKDREQLRSLVPKLLQAAESFNDKEIANCLKLVPVIALVDQMRAGNTDGVVQIAEILRLTQPPPTDALPVLDEIIDHLDQSKPSIERVVSALSLAGFSIDYRQGGMLYLPKEVVEEMGLLFTDLSRNHPEAQEPARPLIEYLRGKVYARRSICVKLIEPILKETKLRKAFYQDGRSGVITPFLPEPSQNPVMRVSEVD